MLRGNAYNNVGNQAAASTVADVLGSPYQMAGKKFVYLEPTNNFAAVSFGTGLTKFLAFDNSQGLGLATVGVANSAFGVAVSYALGKQWTSSEVTSANRKTTQDESAVTGGDRVDLVFAMPIGGLDLTLNGSWITYQREIGSTTEVKTVNNKVKDERDEDFWNILGGAMVSNTPSAKNLAWSAGATFFRHENFTERKHSDKENSDNNYKTEVTGPDAYISVTPRFNIAGTILSASNARVLLGLNTRAPLVFYDEIKEKAEFADDDVNKDNYFTMGVYTAPNIFAELGLGNCWMVFGGASYDWALFTMRNGEFIEDYKDKDNKETTKTTIISMATGVATVQAGARFQYSNFALEATIANGFYNDPLTGFNGGDMIANLGAFINF